MLNLKKDKKKREMNEKTDTIKIKQTELFQTYTHPHKNINSICIPNKRQ